MADILGPHRNAGYLESIESTLRYCSIPEDGIKHPPGVPIHAARVHILLGDYYAAAKSLRSGEYSLTDDQRFDLLSYAATSSDDQALAVVLEAEIDPTLREPTIGATALMEAAHAGSNATKRMQLFRNLGVDPFATMPEGFSALDFAIAAENDAAVALMLKWIDEEGQSRLQLVRQSLAMAVRTDETRAETLTRWLVTRSDDQ